MTLFLKAVEPPNPQVGSEDLMILLDESGSMTEDDLEPTRIGAVRVATEKLLAEKTRRYPKDRLGIMGFSTGARVHHALAEVGTSAASLRAAIQRVDVDGGTNMAAGLRAAARALEAGPSLGGGLLRALRRWVLEDEPASTGASLVTGKRIILLSDGANTGDEDPVRIAEVLKQRGIVIDTIGAAGTPGDVDEDTLKGIASVNRDGTRRYVFIKDTAQLIRRFQKLAGHLRRLEV